MVSQAPLGSSGLQLSKMWEDWSDWSCCLFCYSGWLCCVFPVPESCCNSVSPFVSSLNICPASLPVAMSAGRRVLCRGAACEPSCSCQAELPARGEKLGMNWWAGLGKLGVTPVELYFTLPGVLVLLEQTISQIWRMEISLALQLVRMNPNYKVWAVVRNLLLLPW